MTLLEYGRLKNVTQNSSTKTDDGDAEEFGNLIESQSDENTKLNVRMVTNLMSLQSDELQKAADQYTQLKGQVKADFFEGWPM